MNTTETMDRILREIARQARHHGDWVRLADIAATMDYEPAAWEQAIRELARHPEYRVAPDDDQKNLTQEDRWAAVRIGDHDNHLISYWGMKA